MRDGSPRQRLEGVLADQDVARFYPPAYGRAIWDTVLSVSPELMVEFGVHRGYTAIVAALALEESGRGRLHAYDWWEDGRRDGFDEEAIALGHFERYGTGSLIRLRALDFAEWIVTPERCDLLYFDIDNDGDKLRTMFAGMRDQIAAGTTVLFEGGSKERDRHETMLGKSPIASARELTGYRLLVEQFPSLSIITAGRPRE